MRDSHAPDEDFDKFYDKDKMDELLQIAEDRLLQTVERGAVNLKAQVALREAEIDLLGALQAAMLSSRWRLFDYIGKKINLMEARRNTREALEEYLACDFLPGERDEKLIAEVSRQLRERP